MENDATFIQPDRCEFAGLGAYSITVRLLWLHHMLQSTALLVDVVSVEQSSSALGNDLLPHDRAHRAMREPQARSHCTLAETLAGRLYMGHGPNSRLTLL